MVVTICPHIATIESNAENKLGTIMKKELSKKMPVIYNFSCLVKKKTKKKTNTLLQPI